MAKHVILHSHSLSFEAVLKKLRHQPSAQFRFLSVASDKRYAAAVWKRLFLIAIKRMARRQPELARLTAIEGLSAFSPVSFSNIVRPRVSIAQLREVVAELRGIERRSLRGATTPHLDGLHPEILCHRYEEARRCFQRGFNKKRTQKLWKQWRREAMPSSIRADGKTVDFLCALESEINAEERSILLLATAQSMRRASIRNALSRAGALRARTGYCLSCKFRPVNENEPFGPYCSICLTRASQVNADLK